jgi:nucleoid-associated protein YgaU
MGQFEKVVVLVALLLVTLILAVTFSSDEDTAIQLSMGERAEAPSSEVLAAAPVEEPQADPVPASARREPRGENARTRREASAPAGGAMLEDLTRRQRERERAESEARELPEVPAAPARDLLLDDSHEVRGGAPEEDLPEGSALVTRAGLRETWDPELMAYAWKDGDTWTSVAETYYGDARKVTLLRQFTEGVDLPRAGQEVLVPVHDLRERGPEASTTSVDAEGVEVYTVQEGDSLWAIAKKVYGKGHLWERVYEANREVLARPEDVRPGMELRIP